MAKITIPEVHPWWLRYGTSVFAALAASGLSWIFVHNGLRLHSGFMLTAVVLSAWFGGFGPGLLTLLLTIPPQILLRDPINLWRIDGKAAWAGFCIYLVNAVMTCILFQKRYLQRARTTVSPVEVTGGWIWKMDPADGGTVETRSPEFPNLSATRTLSMWLETVHPDDRALLQKQIQRAFDEGTLTTTFHLLRDDGEIRRVSMLGIKVKDQATSHEYLVATCIEMGAHENPERMEWQALPTR
jgi:hypothetical protein